ncbi:MAG: hypothetical protein FD183_903, partial [Chitinophagaceae bacterium]
MNQLLKNRTLNIIVIVLLIANITSIGLFWLRQERNKPGGNQRGEVVEFLVRELKMNETQKAQLIKLRQQHRASIQSLRKNQEMLKDAFFGLVKQEQAKDAEINSALEKVATADKAIDLITLNHFKAIRKICTAEQQTKFDKIVQEALHMMRPG